MNGILLKGARLAGGRRCDILIRGNRISAVADCIAPQDERIIDCSHFYAIPGLFNLHTHAAMTLMRGVAKRSLQEWLAEIWSIENHLDHETIYWGSKLAVLEMIKTGTTCFADMYWHPAVTAEVVEEMGIRANLSYVLLDGGDREKADLQRAACIKAAKKAAGRSDRISFSVAVHADYTVNEDNMRWAGEFACANGYKLQAHIAETEKETMEDYEKFGCSPVQHFDRLGLIDENFIGAHGVWINDVDIETLGSRRATIVHNVNSNTMLASGYKFKYCELRDAGANVCIGTDGCGSSDNLDVRESMKTMLLLQRAWRNDPKALPLEELMDAATVNGARALGIDAGRIEVGALADIALVDVRRSAFVPDFNFLSNYILAADSSCVDTLICDGKIVMEGRKVAGEDEILDKAEEQAWKLMKKAKNI